MNIQNIWALKIYNQMLVKCYLEMARRINLDIILHSEALHILISFMAKSSEINDNEPILLQDYMTTTNRQQTEAFRSSLEQTLKAMNTFDQMPRSSVPNCTSAQSDDYFTCRSLVTDSILSRMSFLGNLM